MQTAQELVAAVKQAGRPDSNIISYVYGHSLLYLDVMKYIYQ